MEAGGYFRDVFENYKKYKELANRQAYISKNQFSWEKMKDLLGQRLEELVPEFPKQVELKLPKLQKLELPKLKKI